MVVDGSHRPECVNALLRVADDETLIIFDNTDTPKFLPAVQTLKEAGWRRLDFYGLIPCYTYKNCTSIYLKSWSFLERGQFPSVKHSCLGPTCAQAMDPAGWP